MMLAKRYVRESAIKALSISVILGFVAFLAIGGTKSPYALPVLAAAFGLFLVLWLIFTLIGQRIAETSHADETALSGRSDEWISGRSHTDDGIGEAGGDGDD